ncbi:aldehyde dehydrogenase family protein [Roseibacillus persicicus]|uniref:aldehyde dehydrogenase family protein n=1 Tax=Roseibacillus persicicus TaxID=454148 RepID=UPI00398AC8DA
MSRLGIKKTYKLFIGGKFPRTESGRFIEFNDSKGDFLANVSWGSKKDLRNAIVAARSAQTGWADASAYLKGQILYRIAEVLDGRSEQFVSELVAQGLTAEAAGEEVAEAIDLLVHYAGWSDKYSALFSSVNPVASSHFNFSVPEPTGVVGLIAPTKGGLLGLVSVLAPAIVGGNTVVLLASEKFPLTAISFAEVLATSDVPGGVVNILTGKRDELQVPFASHMDVNAVVLCSGDKTAKKAVDLEAAENLKRVVNHPDRPLEASPYHILDLQETKTTWHPIGV